MTETFEQKRRNHPIKITQIAIDKVPLAHIDGFTEEEDLFIQNMHKRLLLTSMELNDSNEVETRKNPDAYIALKGNRKNTLLFIHNHPSTGTFSGVDFKTFCSNESLYAMTVVGNDGGVYTLVKSQTFNSHDALSYYHDLAMDKYKDYPNNGTMAMKELLKTCEKIGLSYHKGGR